MTLDSQSAVLMNHEERLKSVEALIPPMQDQIIKLQAGGGGSTGGNPPGTNYALAKYGTTVVASSVINGQYPAESVNNGNRIGPWGQGEGWNDNTPNQADSLELIFSQARQINQVTLYTLQDDFQHAVQPTDDMLFTLYGITDFDVLALDTTNVWTKVGEVRNNRHVKCVTNFATVTATRLKIDNIKGLQTYSRVLEVEATGP